MSMDTGSTFAPFDLALSDDEGKPYTETLVGRVIGADAPLTVYLTDDGRVMIHSEERSKLWETSPDEVRDHLDSASPETYAAACAALGIDPEVASAIEGASTDPDSN